MVKNEEDIIECFCRYTLGFCDKLLIVEDNSDDETPKILACLIEEGLPIVIIRKEFVPGFKKFDTINDLALQAFEHYGADLVVPLDADEFITTDTNEFVRDILCNLPVDKIHRFHWRTYVYTEDAAKRDGLIFDRFEKYRPAELEKLLKVVVSRELFVEDGYRITVGQHNIGPSDNSPEREYIVSDKLLYAHFPIRSLGQINTKIIIGWLNYQCMPKEGQKSRHWPVMYAAIKEHEGLSNKEAEIFSVFYSYRGEKNEINDNNFHEKLLSKHIDLKPAIAYEELGQKYTPERNNNIIKIGLVLSHIEKMIKGFEKEKNDMKNWLESEKQKEIDSIVNNMEASKSWKIGRLVTFPVRVLKRLKK